MGLTVGVWFHANSAVSLLQYCGPAAWQMVSDSDACVTVSLLTMLIGLAFLDW